MKPTPTPAKTIPDLVRAELAGMGFATPPDELIADLTGAVHDDLTKSIKKIVTPKSVSAKLCALLEKTAKANATS